MTLTVFHLHTFPLSSSMTMGIRLLRKLGWRDGQGVGPRIRKKKKKRKQTGM